MNPLTIAFLFPLLALTFAIFRYLVFKAIFDQSEYASETKTTFYKTMKDTGAYGEYLTAQKLVKLSGVHRLVANTYIPNGRGGTTEIDLLFIHETGIYVIESKNYSGWIFGKESDRYWTQQFPNGQKKRFLNPVLQNKGHINALKKLLSDIDENLIYSTIVFSQRCELKKVKLDSSAILLCRRQHLQKKMKRARADSQVNLSVKQIDTIYNRVKAYAGVSEGVKKAHIQKITKHV